MAQLTVDQMKSVAALKTDPGFILLLEALQAEIDDVATAIDEVISPDHERRLVVLWKTLRRVYAVLKSAPEAMLADVEDEVQRMRDDPSFEIRPLNKVDQLKAYYNQIGKTSAGLPH